MSTPSTLSRLVAVLLVATVLIPFTLAAEPPVDPKEAELERLVREAPKIHLPKLLDYNLQKLDAVFAARLREAGGEEERTALRQSQEAWLAFFKTDGVVAAWNAEGGSYAYPAQVEQRLHQVHLRIYQLATPFLQGWQKVPRVPFPVAPDGKAKPNE